MIAVFSGFDFACLSIQLTVIFNFAFLNHSILAFLKSHSKTLDHRSYQLKLFLAKSLQNFSGSAIDLL